MNEVNLLVYNSNKTCTISGPRVESGVATAEEEEVLVGPPGELSLSLAAWGDVFGLTWVGNVAMVALARLEDGIIVVDGPCVTVNPKLVLESSELESMSMTSSAGGCFCFCFCFFFGWSLLASLLLGLHLRVVLIDGFVPGSKDNVIIVVLRKI